MSDRGMRGCADSVRWYQFKDTVEIHLETKRDGVFAKCAFDRASARTLALDLLRFADGERLSKP